MGMQAAVAEVVEAVRVGRIRIICLPAVLVQVVDLKVAEAVAQILVLARIVGEGQTETLECPIQPLVDRVPPASAML